MRGQLELLCRCLCVTFGQVFTSFDRNTHAKTHREYVKGWEIFIGQDFGWAAPTAIVFIQVDPQENVYVIDELMYRETPIASIGAGIKNKGYGESGIPNLLFCDPAGDNKNEAMGTSSVAELRKQGFRVKYKKNYPGVIQDGIGQIRKWINNGKFFIDPKCTNLIQAMEMYRYPDPKDDIQSEIPLKDGISDHWIDALRYFFLNRFPARGAEWRVL